MDGTLAQGRRLSLAYYISETSKAAAGIAEANASAASASARVSLLDLSNGHTESDPIIIHPLV